MELEYNSPKVAPVNSGTPESGLQYTGVFIGPVVNNYKIMVAYDKKRGIGYNLDIPWHIPEDLKRFKVMTMGQTVIMGSKTFQSVINQLGKPLPGRTNIVLSKKLENLDYDNCLLFHNVADVLNSVEKAWILGGNYIYSEFLPYVNEIYATEIDEEYTCDTFFPEINPQEWQARDIEQREGYRFITYIRNKV